MTAYVFRRPSGYCFRYVVPKPCRGLLNQRELRYPLRTHERRAATRRAREVAQAVERLLYAVMIGDIKLSPEEIREKVKAYARDRRELIDSEFLERRRSSIDQETHEGVLAGLLETVEYALQHSDYRQCQRELSGFLGLPPEQSATDPDLAPVRRQWALATSELYRYQLGLYRGEPMAGEAECLSEPTGVPGSSAGCTGGLKSLSDWLQPFIEQKAQTTNPGRDARDRYRHAVTNFETLVGKVPAAHITGEHVTVFMRDVQKLPIKRKLERAYSEYSVKELVEAGIPEEDRYTASTINGCLGALSAMMRWLRESHGAVSLNPFDGKRLKAERKVRPSYSDEDLELIFTSELWACGTSFSRRNANASMWWLPLLALYTGARLSELVQLPLDRMREVEGVLCLDLVDAHCDGIQLKTVAARRRIPVLQSWRASGSLTTWRP